MWTIQHTDTQMDSKQKESVPHVLSMSTHPAVPSDNTSTTSAHSSRKKAGVLHLVKKEQEEVAIMFDPPMDESEDLRRLFDKEADDSMFLWVSEGSLTL